MKTAVAYIRVSKEKEEGMSPSSQLSKIRQYCKLHDLNLVEVYRDIDITGRRADIRPGLQEMLQRIDNGDVRYVVVYKLDRLARSVGDFHRMMERLERNGCDLVSVSQNIDTSTPVGRLLRNILVDFAQFESEMIGERVRDNMLYVVETKGKWLAGSPPIGYRIAKDGLVIDEKRAEVVRWIFQQYLAGNGTRTIARELTQRAIPTPTGGKRWHYSTVNNILSNRAYIGQIQWQGKAWDGNHEPIIDEATFERTQQLMRANNVNPGNPAREHLLGGLLRCGVCGKGANIKFPHARGRYLCGTRNQIDRQACANVSLDEPSLVRRIEETIRSLDVSRLIAKKERSLPRSTPLNRDDELHTIERRLQQINALIDRLFEDHYEYDLITRDQFAEQNSRYLDEKARLLERLEELRQGNNHVELSKEELRLSVEAADALAASWSEMTTVEKRLAVRTVIREIVWTPDGAELHWQFGETTSLDYDAVRRGTAYFDDSWKHPCQCGYLAKTAAGLASHQRTCMAAH